VNKWAQEEYLISEQDEPYQAKDGQCDMGKVDRATKVYGVRDYRYIGGGYGKGSEREIMQELVHNGPVIMNFEPTFEFMYYTKGIYHSKDADWVQENSEQPEWVPHPPSSLGKS
jgi:cathepsin C